MTFDQSSYDIRCEWGAQGIAALAPTSDVVIIVDVMSFSTCVAVAASRGAEVHPWRSHGASAVSHAHAIGAELAGSRRQGGYSLSPASLRSIPSGTRLVLPSPNGATLSLATGSTPTLAGCLRNARSVAHAAMTFGRRIAVIPAGERWKADDALRPAIEDLLGAGAIIQHLEGRLSPEARIAKGAFLEAQRDLATVLRECASGQELVQMGFGGDLALIGEVDSDRVAPHLDQGAYRA